MRAPFDGRVHIYLGPVYFFFPMMRKNVLSRSSSHYLFFRGRMWLRLSSSARLGTWRMERLGMLRFTCYSNFRSLHGRAHGNKEWMVILIFTY